MSERMVKLDVRAQADLRRDSGGAQQGSGGLGERPAEENVDMFRRALSGDEAAVAGDALPSERDAVFPGQGHASNAQDAERVQGWRDRGAFGLFGSMTSFQPDAPASPLSPPGLSSAVPELAAMPVSAAPLMPAATPMLAATPVQAATLEPHVATGTSGAADSSASRLADEVADRILVSADDGREARVFVRDDVMPGVEIRITQDQGRWLVAFIIGDGKSFEVLERAGQKIADELATRLKCDVEVQLIAAESPDGKPRNSFLASSDNSTGAP